MRFVFVIYLFVLALVVSIVLLLGDALFIADFFFTPLAARHKGTKRYVLPGLNLVCYHIYNEFIICMIIAKFFFQFPQNFFRGGGI